MKLIAVAIMFGLAANSAAAPDWNFVQDTGRGTLAVEGGRLAFRCTEGGPIVAAFSLEGDVLDAFDIRASTTKPLTVDLSIAGAQEQIEVVYTPRSKMLFATKGDARRLFNAAIRGDEISIDAGGRGSATLTPPAADAESFRAFKSGCGL